MVQEMSLKDISSNLELWWLLCSAERNHLCNLVEGIIRNISAKLFRIQTSNADVVKRNFSASSIVDVV